jgi:hypothetical protein
LYSGSFAPETSIRLLIAAGLKTPTPMVATVPEEVIVADVFVFLVKIAAGPEKIS